MKLRKLVLSLVLFTNAFAHNAALTSSSVQTIQLRTNVGFAQPVARNTSGFDPAYRLSLLKPVQDKNFYLLSLFQRNQQARKLLSRNKALRQLAKDKMLALKKASSCDNIGCVDELIRFNGPNSRYCSSRTSKVGKYASVQAARQQRSATVRCLYQILRPI
jgi:hypothetical protein